MSGKFKMDGDRKRSGSLHDYFTAKTKKNNIEDKKDYQGKAIAFLM